MSGEEEKERSAVCGNPCDSCCRLLAAYVGAFRPSKRSSGSKRTIGPPRNSFWLLDVPQALAHSRRIPVIWLRCRVPTPPKKQVRPEMLKSYIYEFRPALDVEIHHYSLRQSRGFPVRLRTGHHLLRSPKRSSDTLRAHKTTDTIEYSRMRDVFSEPFFESNYDLYNSVYGASPAQTSPFMNGTEAMRKNVLLLWKLAFGFDRPGIHAIAFGNNRGFEFGDPARRHSRGFAHL